MPVGRGSTLVIPLVVVPWYDWGMTRYQKIAISLPWRAAENVRRAVKRGAAPSVSAYVTAAIEAKLGREDTLAILDQMLEETGGPMTAAERRRIDRELDTPVSYGPFAVPKKPRRRRRK